MQASWLYDHQASCSTLLLLSIKIDKQKMSIIFIEKNVKRPYFSFCLIQAIYAYFKVFRQEKKNKLFWMYSTTWSWLCPNLYKSVFKTPRNSLLISSLMYTVHIWIRRNNSRRSLMAREVTFPTFNYRLPLLLNMWP